MRGLRLRPTSAIRSRSTEVLYAREESDMGSTEVATMMKKSNENNDVSDIYGPNLKLLPCNNQVKELQTILRDK